MFQFYIVSTLLLVSSVSASAIPQANQTWGCDDPFECAHTWAMNRRPLLRFDGAAGGHCFPDEATNANNGECRDLNEDAPIYYNIVRCGDYLKLVWHVWYGHQKGCTSLGIDQGHDDDWEMITINFILTRFQYCPIYGCIGGPEYTYEWVQDSVTYYQHNGHYTRLHAMSTSDPHQNDVWVGKVAHGSYDNWCDGHGAVWEQDYCAGGCGYWDDFRNDNDNSRWRPSHIKHVSEVTDSEVNRVKNIKHFDKADKNSCVGSNSRCVDGPCGCWRNDHTFPADTICDV